MIEHPINPDHEFTCARCKGVFHIIHEQTDHRSSFPAMFHVERICQECFSDIFWMDHAYYLRMAVTLRTIGDNYVPTRH